MAREKSEGGRVLTSTEIRLGKNNFTLLNSEKLGRALDWLDEIETPKAESDQAALAAAQKMGAKKDAILALYDRFGGAVRLGERILKTGAFWDFAAKKPLKKADLSEEDFGDEYRLVRKKSRKASKREQPEDRIRRLESKARNLDKEEAVE